MANSGPTRFVVVGGTGSGKSTLASALAARHGVEHIELDGLWWRPGWAHISAAELAEQVTALLDDHDDGWVVDGNYLDDVGPLTVWPRAEVVIWLDLPRAVAFRRAVLRTIRRAATRQPLWDGHVVQSWKVLSPASVIALWHGWPSYANGIDAAIASGHADALQVVRLRSDAEVRAWLTSAAAARSTGEDTGEMP